MLLSLSYKAFCARNALLSSAEICDYRKSMKLYSYFRSTAAYRVRIVLNLKGLAFETVSINLRGGDHLQAEYRARNPQARIPSLELANGAIIGQSPAIIEYLEENYRLPPLLPADSIERAKIRMICSIIACDIHPLNNMSVLNYLKNDLAQDEASVAAWYANWINQGFSAIETIIAPAPYAFGKEISLADVYIVPQVYNAQRFNVPLKAFPKIVAVAKACEKLDAFARAHPSCQPDTET
jgi:maleylacetoacetate isomerase